MNRSLARISPIILRFSAAALALAVAVSPSGAPIVGAGRPPATVYVYDSEQFDGFDHNCQGWIWTEMGFLDSNGKPAKDGTKKGDTLKVGDNAVGTVIGDKGGTPNAYSNADGSAEAYDLSKGATL